MTNSDTHSILDAERRLLRRIGSERDPALFQAMRTFIRDERTMNRTVIVNFSGEDGSHGCRFKCDYCSWRDRAVLQGDIYPETEDLDAFLAGFSGTKVTVSGGGDPLFDLERNSPRLMHLVDRIHSHGLLVEVITMEWDVAAEECRPGARLDCIDMWSLSAQGRSEKLRRAVRSLSSSGHPVRVSRVCTPGRNLDLGRWVDFYLEAGAYQCVLREDFYHQGMVGHDMRAVASQAGRCGVRWLKSKTCSDNLFLIGKESVRGDPALGTSVPITAEIFATA